MRAERLLAVGAVAFIAGKCAVLASNAVRFPVLNAHPVSPTAAAGVSVLIPARDEESNLTANLPALLCDARVGEVLVLDDGSTDGTAEVVRRFAATDPRVRLLTGQPLPPGWTGKTWACHQLAAAATHDLLLFCDADVRLAPGAVPAIVAEAAKQNSAVFSVFPRQQTNSVGERLLVPLIDDVLLCFLPHDLLDAPVPAAATANGQLLMFHRHAYDRLGGHAAVRGAIVEDVRLALNTRRAGLRLGLALGGSAVTARMYDGYAATVRGFAKSLRAAHGGSRALVIATSVGHLAAYTAPWVAIGRTARRRGVLDPWWATAAGLGLLERAMLNHVTGRRAYWEVSLIPLTPVAALPLAASALRRTRRWKGRTYP